LARWTSSARKLMQRARIDNQIPLPLGGSPAQLRAASRRSGASATGSPIRRSRNPTTTPAQPSPSSTVRSVALHRAIARRARSTSTDSRIRVFANTVSSTIRRPDATQDVNRNGRPSMEPQLPQLPVQLPGVRLPPAAAPDPQRDRHRRPPTRTAMSATPTASHGSPGHQLPVGHEWKRNNGSRRPIIRPTRAVDQHRNPRAAQRRYIAIHAPRSGDVDTPTALLASADGQPGGVIGRARVTSPSHKLDRAGPRVSAGRAPAASAARAGPARSRRRRGFGAP
jgi:hypothetical protein